MGSSDPPSRDQQVLPTHGAVLQEPVAAGGRVCVQRQYLVGVGGVEAVDRDGRAVVSLEEVAELGPVGETVDPQGLLPRHQIVTRSPNRVRTWSARPHSGAGDAPGGGGGAYGFIAANS